MLRLCRVAGAASEQGMQGIMKGVFLCQLYAARHGKSGDCIETRLASLVLEWRQGR